MEPQLPQMSQAVCEYKGSGQSPSTGFDWQPPPWLQSSDLFVELSFLLLNVEAHLEKKNRGGEEVTWNCSDLPAVNDTSGMRAHL